MLILFAGKLIVLYIFAFFYDLYFYLLILVIVYVFVYLFTFCLFLISLCCGLFICFGFECGVAGFCFVVLRVLIGCVK